MSELKKCPFCGGEAHSCYNVTNGYWKIMCIDCGIAVIPNYPDEKTMPSFETKEEAIAHWNTRKPVDDVVEALEKRLEEQFKLYAIAFDPEDRGGYDAYNDAIEIVKEHLT